jgi:cellulose synthase/poly-beta-1,6-N-acetylglucosamine synthase-like glycosyltransferase
VTTDRTGNASGKVLALISAVEKARHGSKILAFADSDCWVRRDWLHNLVVPLQSKDVGATTSFRWYPDSGSFLSGLVSAWNASGANLMFDSRYNFVWGGSWAIRRELYDKLGVSERMSTHLSDDQAVTQAIREAGLAIRYIPKSTALSDPRSRFRSYRHFLEWAVIQVAITRIYNARLWRFAALSYSSFNITTLIGVLTLMLSAALNDFWLGLLSVVMLSHIILGMLRADLRWRTFRETMSNNDRAFRGRWRHIASSLLVSWIMTYSIIRSRNVTHFPWRGRTYKVDAHGQVVSVTEH